MVYELKVTLNYSDLPAKRTLHVRKETSLRQLHHILQTVFDWHGGSSHLFSGVQPGKEMTWIGNTRVNNQLLWNQTTEEPVLDILEERKEILSDWLTSPGDQLLYQYDPKQNWVHTVELVKVRQPEEAVFYPICTAASYHASLEVVSKEMLKEDFHAYVHTPDDLVDIVNESLTRSLPILSAEDVEEVDDVWEDLLLASRAFKEAKPWELFSNNQFFVVVEPQTDTPLFCSVSGMDGTEPGLNIYIGEESFAHLLDSSAVYEETADAVKTVHALSQIEALSLLYKEEDELDAEDKHLLASHSVVFDRKETLPMFSSICPDYSIPTQLTTEEAEWMLLVVEQTLEIMDLVKKGLELPELQNSSALLARVYSPEYQQFVNHELKVIVKQ